MLNFLYIDENKIFSITLYYGGAILILYVLQFCNSEINPPYPLTTMMNQNSLNFFSALSELLNTDKIDFGALDGTCCKLN